MILVASYYILYTVKKDNVSVKAEVNYPYVLLAIVFGLCSTFVFYIGFGRGDSIEQLPIIYRCIDNTYLQKDFFVNASSSSIVRRVFAELVALIAGIKENVSLVYFILLSIANSSISVVTYFFTKKLFNEISISGLYAAAAAMYVTVFELGWSGNIYFNMLTPASLAVPLLMYSIYIIMQLRVVPAILICILATLLHPLMGIEGTLLNIAVYIVGARINGIHSRKKLTTLVLCVIAYIAFVLFFLHSYLRIPEIDNETYVHILAYFRHPHHYLPGRIANDFYYGAVIFTLAGLTSYVVHKAYLNSKIALLIFVYSVIIIAVCIIGYFFTERLNSRVWTIAQPLRQLYFIKWFIIVFIAGGIGTYHKSFLKPLHLLSLLTSALAYISLTARVLYMKYYGSSIKRYYPIEVVIVILTVLLGVVLNIKDFYLPLYIAFIALAGIMGISKPVGKIVSILAFTAATGLFISFCTKALPMKRMTIENSLTKDELGIMSFIYDNTEEEALFLIPPGLGSFRLVAKRSVVVDYKAFPFTDEAMLEWYKRMLKCYGDVEVNGVYRAAMFDVHYKKIDDKSLSELKSVYDFNYAVIYTSTNTHREIIYSNDTYALIHL